jgi:hypothetical protein
MSRSEGACPWCTAIKFNCCHRSYKIIIFTRTLCRVWLTKFHFFFSLSLSHSDIVGFTIKVNMDSSLVSDHRLFSDERTTWLGWVMQHQYYYFSVPAPKLERTPAQPGICMHECSIKTEIFYTKCYIRLIQLQLWHCMFRILLRGNGTGSTNSNVLLRFGPLNLICHLD